MKGATSSYDKSRVFLVISVTTLANLLTGFAARLAVVGMPTISHDIRANVWEMVWIIQGYMLGSTFIQLIVGRLADLYGRVKLFNIGILVFTLGALLSGLSSSPSALIFSRILQGVGGAFLISLSIAILADNIPSNMLGKWLGINQVTWRVGALMGLTLSGFIVDYMGWRWIFLIQVPIGTVALIWSYLKLRDVYKPVEKEEIDWIGFASFTFSITLLLVGLTLLGYGYSSYSYILVFSSIIFLSLFTIVELRTKAPALDLRIFKIRQFTGGVIAQLLYSIGFGASLTLLAIYLQSVAGYDASTTGLLLTPYELVFLVSGIIGGVLSDMVGFVKITVLGLAAGSLALYVFSTMNSLRDLMIGEILFGIGTGLFVSPNTASIMSCVPPERRGVASSIRTLSFNIGFMASLNLAILTITTRIPYEEASQLITLGYVTLSSNVNYELNELTIAIKRSFLVQSAIMALAIPFSFLRSKRNSLRFPTLGERSILIPGSS
ncbi:MAG: MFS transporter [Desulfurococcaceae archaeon]